MTNNNRIFKEGAYQIDCSKAIYASNGMRDYYQQDVFAKYQLSDVDWVIEDDDYIYLVEYKNSNVNNAIDMKIEKKIDSLSKKFHHSLLFLFAIGTTKQVKCIAILDSQKDDVYHRCCCHLLHFHWETRRRAGRQHHCSSFDRQYHKAV
ncbi:MAG: hypothetical protein WBK46_11515 [Ruminococcus flavefaciens]